jgi:hypothetical protein
MLVLDEQLKDHHLIAAVAAWYPGTVTHIQTLRPASVIKDDNIATVLLTVRNATFITINVIDFWRKMLPHPGYCILTIDLAQGDFDEFPTQLRRLFTLPLLKTRSMRMGKVMRVQTNRIRYYERGGQIQEIEHSF